jgi:methionyl-tRNA formyltransferase
MGTPELACVSLQALLETPGVELQAVVTQPDRPKGRDLRLQPPPVKELARRANLPVLQPEKAREPGFIEELRRLEPDLIAVAAYGQLLPPDLLALPRLGCVNVHTSLLPKYRGAAPIQWAILNGDAESGVTIMKMDAGLDSGAILSQATTPITPEDTAQTLHDRLARLGADLLVKTIPGYVTGDILPQPQPSEGVSHAPKIKREHGRIDWAQPAAFIWNRIRGLVPWPGAFTFLPAEPKPHLLKIWKGAVVERSSAPGEILQADKGGILVGCGTDALLVAELQLEGSRRLSAQEFLAGHRLEPGARLG